MNFFLFFQRFYLFIFRERGREEDRGRNINVWLPLTCPLLGTWPATQACALTGNWISDSFVSRLALNPLSTPARALRIFFNTSFFYYYCSSTLVSIFILPHTFPPHSSLPPTLKPTPFGFVHGSFMHVPWWPFPYFPPFTPSSPLWLVSACSLFQCLWS